MHRHGLCLIFYYLMDKQYVFNVVSLFTTLQDKSFYDFFNINNLITIFF